MRRTPKNCLRIQLKYPKYLCGGHRDTPGESDAVPRQ